MKKAVLFLLSLLCVASIAWAQSDKNITDAGDALLTEEDLQGEQSEKNEYVMWADPLFYQFEKMLPQLSRSIGRLDSRVSTLAVTDLKFSPGLDESFKKVATAKLYGQLLLENPRLKLIKCSECNMIRSDITNGILTVSRGLSNQKERRKLAEKLGVQGFMTAMIVENERQLTIVVNVYDAQEGQVILSDVVTGVPVPESDYWNIYFGQMILPVTLESGTSVSQSAYLIGAEKSIRFSESWMVSSNFALYNDNNSKLGTNKVDYFQFTTGLMIDGSVGWEAVSMMNNNGSVIVSLGLGDFISPQFNFAVYQKLGVKVIFGNILTFNLYYLNFDETNLDKPDETTGNAHKLNGSGYYLTFGYQF